VLALALARVIDLLPVAALDGRGGGCFPRGLAVGLAVEAIAAAVVAALLLAPPAAALAPVLARAAVVATAFADPACRPAVSCSPCAS
jgi:hypothetical protein